MERTIDRTSYRRNARQNIHEEKKNVKKFKATKIFLNQIIVCLVIVIAILVARYYNITFIDEWIRNNMSEGLEISEIFGFIKNKFNNLFGIISGDVSNSGELLSGESLSGEFLSGEFLSGEFLSGEFLSGEKILPSAVEGVNQMADDAIYIKSNYNIIAPLKGTITSHFGSRISDNVIVSSYHTGLDIAANTGTSIIAAHDGTVTLAQKYSTYGNCIIIENGSLKTLYAHCSSINVKKGQKINQSEVIGKVGMTGNATGPHLHFEIRLDGRFVNPEDVLGEI